MRKILSIIVCAAVMTTLCGCGSKSESSSEPVLPDNDRVNSIEESKPEWEYKEVDGGVSVEQYNGKSGEVKIPAEIDGKPVVKIGDRVFVRSEKIASVDVPASVEEIDDEAFELSVERVNIASENKIFCSKDGMVYTKEDNALYICPGGRTGEVAVPEGTTAIADYAFGSCLNITAVTLPDGVDKIGWGAFGYCENLKSVNIPSSVTEIEGYAFKDCTSLTELEIPKSVTEIGTRAFEGTPFLDALRKKDPLVVINNILADGSTAKGEVTIPDGVVGISGHAFEVEYGENPDITKVTIPDSVSDMGECVFENCVNLEEVKLSAGLSELFIETFAGCKSLKSIDIPSGVEIIGSCVFEDCSALENVTVPDSVTSCYYDNCFRGCEKIKCCLPRKMQKIDKQNTKNKPPKIYFSAAKNIQKRLD